MPRNPLTRLRLRLTAWYVATFSVILLLLGGGLFLVIRHRLAVQLDRSLEEATADLEHAARIREQESGIRGGVVDAVDELHIPERTLYLLDSTGRAIKPASADPWIAEAARTAIALGAVDLDHHGHRDRTLRLHAERFALASGRVMVAAAVADRIELEDRYAELIAAFGGAALIALVLVAGGGWLLVRQSTAPIERNIERMRRFMADAAHELRTPLTVLRSQAEVALQQERDGPGYVAALRGVEAESQRLGRIVEDLLTIARADAGERPIARQAVYLDDIALDAANTARAMADAKGVTLAVDRFEEAPVTGDSELLRQLVMILLDNAVKFTPTAGRVELGVGIADAAVSLTVRDTGYGIPADQLPHIFERFYRGDPARTRGAHDSATQTGAGLGLAIARWIANAHGAEISVVSEVGAGTTVTVRFPGAARDTAMSSA